MHGLIVGQTGTGKTTLAIKLASLAQANNHNVLVYDPHLSPSWANVDYLTDNIDKFLSVAKQNRSCLLIIDEAAEVCTRANISAAWLATQSRHKEHHAYFITQHLKSIAPIIRGNCTKLFCFNVTPPNAAILYDEYGHEELLQAHDLEKGEFLLIERMKKAKKYNIFENTA